MVESGAIKFAFTDFGNEQVAALPAHLKKYIVDQHYDQYTPVDHALWRYVMRQNYSYLKDAAYYPYIPGLRMAGLTIEKIPSLQEMNDALGKIGWGAVTVDGFIPPAAFMEYQARRVLVIAADIRQLDHIEYTSAPDIIHESAGHAPIISDTKYNQYLSYLGFIGTKALFSSKDYELYESIRQLSILKEIPNVEKKKVEEAEQKVIYLQKNLGAPSEMAMLSRLQWWTVEYGLIGSLENPKIYGAGLLSSIGESSWCMRPEVKKLLYTIDAQNFSYDITQPQPQLFVTPTFQNLIDVLKQFEDKMAWRRGGVESVNKAIECRNICTAELDSGIQISGIFKSIEQDQAGNITMIRTTGKTALCYQDHLMEGLGPENLPNGYLTILGKFKDKNINPSKITPDELIELNLSEGKIGFLKFENGAIIEGEYISSIYKDSKLVLLNFKQATVRHAEHKFAAEHFDFFSTAIGMKVTSVFNGAADKTVFKDDSYVSGERTWKFNYTEKDLRYHALFKSVREIRESHQDKSQLKSIWTELKREFPNDWLCKLEILEMVSSDQLLNDLHMEIRNHLGMLSKNQPSFFKLINDGLGIVDNGLVFE